MLGGWDDDEYINFSDEEIGKLHELRRFVNEEGNNTSSSYDEWDNKSYSIKGIRTSLGHWHEAIASVGGNTDNLRKKTQSFDKEEMKEIFVAFAENSLKYEVDGEKYFSPINEAVPYSHIVAINPNLNMPEKANTISTYFQSNYTEIIDDLGYKHPLNKRNDGKTEEFDWERVRERLKSDIEGKVDWRRETYKEGEIPPMKYFEHLEDYPNPTQLHEVLGNKENWKKELGLIETGADTVNVDPAEFGL